MSNQSIISNNLKKYNYGKEQYDIDQMTLIIKGAHTHSILLYKEYLIYNDNLEFLDAFFPLHKSLSKLKDLLFVYENCSYIFPNYTPLPECKYIYNNILKKQNLINCIESLVKKEKNKVNNNQLITLRVYDDQKIFNSVLYEEIIKDTANQSIIKNIFGNSKKQNKDSLKSIIDLTDKIKNSSPPPQTIFKFLKNSPRKILYSKKTEKNTKNNSKSKIQIYNSFFKPFPVKSIDLQSILKKNSSKNIFSPKKIFDLINSKKNKKIHKRNINNLTTKNNVSSMNILPTSISNKRTLFTNYSYKKYSSKEKSQQMSKSNSLFSRPNEKFKILKIKNHTKASQINEQNLFSTTKYTKNLKKIFLNKSSSNAGFFGISKKLSGNNTFNSKFYKSTSGYKKDFTTKPLSIQIGNNLKNKLINYDAKTNKISKIEVKRKQNKPLTKKILDFSNKYATSNTTSVSSINPSSRRIIVDVKKQIKKNSNIKKNANSIFSQRLMTEIHYKSMKNTTINSNQQINPFIVPKIKKLNFKVIKLNNSNSKDMKYKKLDKKK